MKLIQTPLRPRADDPCPVCSKRLGCQPETAGYPVCGFPPHGCGWWPTEAQQRVYETTPHETVELP